MSRIGKKPITLPAGVAVTISGNTFKAKGPKGELSYELHPHVQIAQNDNILTLSIADHDNQGDRALWGTMRQIINNTVQGVATGYSKQLE
ncbi:MAG TPA: 50S ribosomal protein L6, partial [Patescibacteria group bacterium]|nr:50S ribosomal protein L6 [Patescibacteria group bacterium]